MMPSRVLARVQGFARVRQMLVSSSVRGASTGKHREYSAVVQWSSPAHWIPSSLKQSSVHFSRLFAAGAPVKQDEMNEIIEEINSKFAEAREEIELAAESKETVYFNEEAETAKKAVNEVLELFNNLLARLPESERGALQRSMGLKMEQLKAEVAQLNE